jgi:polyisoprenoid-binding protein YceI
VNAITAAELKRRLDGADVILLDLLTPEDYAAGHIPGARNACVYEMVFLDRVTECTNDLECALILYDATGTTRTTATAREKLERAGYRNITSLEGGLAAWEAAGYPLERGQQSVTAEASVVDGVYLVDTGVSVVEWIGRNINNRHSGRIVLADGEVLFTGGVLSGGRFVLDMTSISNLDLQDATWRDLLIRHLLSDDFFEVERYPTASFVVTGYEPLPGASPGMPNGHVTGNLTIRDVTRPITFPAVISAQGDGSIKAHTAFDIDRTLWNVCYGSGKHFERLGMHLVHDLISLELFLLARSTNTVRS